MKFLTVAVLALGASQAVAGLPEVVEMGKKNAAQVFSDLKEPRFRSLRVIFARDGKPALLCGEISGQNKPSFIKFHVPFELDSGNYRRPENFPEKIWDELTDAVCDSPGSGLKVTQNPP